MTEKQILLVKKSWKVFRDIDPGKIGDVFYSKLFIDHPELRKMFPRNMEEQYKKLIDMLSTIVSRLDHLNELNDDIYAMAQRHVAYGVKDYHYKMVGDALMWTLQQGLGKDWSGELNEAWAACYNSLAGAMMKPTAFNK